MPMPEVIDTLEGQQADANLSSVLGEAGLNDAIGALDQAMTAAEDAPTEAAARDVLLEHTAAHAQMTRRAALFAENPELGLIADSSASAIAEEEAVRKAVVDIAGIQGNRDALGRAHARRHPEGRPAATLRRCT